MKKKLLVGALFASSLLAATGSQAQTFPNASFETWHNLSVGSLALETPNNWHGTDSLIASIAPLAALGGFTITPVKQLYKSTSSHSGQFAAEIQSQNIGSDVGNIPGVLSNAKIGVDFAGLITGGNLSDPTSILQYLSYTEATPVTQRVDTVSAWIKLDSTNLDTASITVMAVKTVQSSTGTDSIAIVGQGDLFILPVINDYLQAQVPVQYIDGVVVPQELIVVFASSTPLGDSIHAGNKLFVDDVAYSYESNGTSIRQPLMAEQVALVYPNPASNTVYFNLNPQVRAADYTLTVSDISGRVVLREQLQQAVNARNVKSWVKGTYFYNISNSHDSRSAKGKFVVE